MSRRRSLSAFVLIVLGAIATANLAHAQQAATTGAATALFDEGVALMEKGDFTSACPKLARSNELAPNGGTMFALAECYEKSGQTASAWVTYREAAIRASAAKRQDAADKANASAARLEPKISRVTVEVPKAADIAGLAITLDGRSVARAEWGVASPIDPGKHAIDATAPDHKPFHTAFTVDANAKGGGSKQLVSIPALAVAAPSSSSPAGATAANADGPPRGRTQRILGLVATGVGLVGIGAGTFFGLSASSKNDDAASHCPRDQSLCDSEGIRLDKEGRDAAMLSTISFIAGGVLTAGGLVLFFTAPSGRESTSANATAGTRLHLHATSVGVSTSF